MIYKGEEGKVSVNIRFADEGKTPRRGTLLIAQGIALGIIE